MSHAPTSSASPESQPDSASASSGAGPRGAQSERGPPRLRFPLWLRLGLAFGGFVTLLLATLGALDLQAERARIEAEHRASQLGMARVLADAVDGDAILEWREQADMERPEYRAMAHQLARARSDAGLRWVGIYGRSQDYVYYVMDASLADPLPFRFPYFDQGPAMEQAFQGEAAFATGVRDEWGRWDCAYAPIQASSGEVVGVLSVESDHDWRQVLADQKVRQVVARVALASGLAFVLALLLARYLARHLDALARAAGRVARGKLDTRVEIASRDEVGQLARAFNQMVQGLREREVMREAVGRYVSPEVARQLLEDPDAARPGGTHRHITVLMSDLRGFSGLSRRLGAEEMIGLLNDYLERMGEVIEAHGGRVNEYLGDAILALWGEAGEASDDALRAVACAVEMQRALEVFNEELARRGLDRLEMGIGLNSGDVILGNIGSSHHVKWGVVGDAVNMAARVETFTVGGEVLLTRETLVEAGPLVEARGPIRVKVKGAVDSLELFAVLKVGGAFDCAVPAEVRAVVEQVPVRLEAGVARIVDKEVLPTRLRARIVSLGSRGATVAVSGTLAVYDDVQLRILLPDGPLDEVYAKVVRAEPGGALDLPEHSGEAALALVRFTSLPAGGRKRLEEVRREASQPLEEVQAGS